MSDTGITFVYRNYKESWTTMTYMRITLKHLCRTMQSLPPKVQEAYEQNYCTNSQPIMTCSELYFLQLYNSLVACFLHWMNVL